MTREEAKEFIAQSVKSDVDMALVADAIKALEQEPTTKNDLGVASGLEKNSKKLEKNFGELDCISRADAISAVSEALKHTFVEHEDIANKIIGKLPSVTPQEPKPMVEIDLYSVIKQKYIEREVLDKIRAEIVELTKCPYGTECLGANCPSNTDCMICGDHVLDILDKYNADRSVE